MLGKLALTLLLLVMAASAESVTVGDYNVTFNYNKLHENMIINNNTSLLIQTFNGSITMWPGSIDHISDLSSETQKFLAEQHWEDIIIDGRDAKLYIGSDGFLVQSLSEDAKSFQLYSDLPFYDLADFLRTVHIEQIN
jgi:hypothetical protein